MGFVHWHKVWDRLSSKIWVFLQQKCSHEKNTAGVFAASYEIFSSKVSMAHSTTLCWEANWVVAVNGEHWITVENFSLSLSSVRSGVLIKIYHVIKYYLTCTFSSRVPLTTENLTLILVAVTCLFLRFVKAIKIVLANV